VLNSILYSVLIFVNFVLYDDIAQAMDYHWRRFRKKQIWKRSFGDKDKVEYWVTKPIVYEGQSIGHTSHVETDVYMHNVYEKNKSIFYKSLYVSNFSIFSILH